jgi:hypothetical protein
MCCIDQLNPHYALAENIRVGVEYVEVETAKQTLSGVSK